MLGCVCNTKQGSSFCTVTSLWLPSLQLIHNGAVNHTPEANPAPSFLHFQLTKGLCLRQSSNTFLHVLTPIKHLSVCWAGVQIRVSLHSKEDVSHLLNQIQAARMLHWMDHGQGQMLQTKADFAKADKDMIIDKKSCFKCGKFTYKNFFYYYFWKGYKSFLAVGFSVEGRQCWLPAGPIGLSLDTSRCRIDPALPTATSTTDLEHIQHIPTMILQASAGNILSAPGQHCRPIMNSRGHTPETEQRKTQGKYSEKERCDSENRRKPAWMKGENPFRVIRWHKLPTWRAKISGCCQGLNIPHIQDIGQRKVLKTAFKSSHSRALMHSCSPEVTLLTCPGLLKTSDRKWFKLNTKFNIWAL